MTNNQKHRASDRRTRRGQERQREAIARQAEERREKQAREAIEEGRQRFGQRATPELAIAVAALAPMGGAEGKMATR